MQYRALSYAIWPNQSREGKVEIYSRARLKALKVRKLRIAYVMLELDAGLEFQNN
jgi:hypothetical protein